MFYGSSQKGGSYKEGEEEGEGVKTKGLKSSPFEKVLGVYRIISNKGEMV